MLRRNYSLILMGFWAAVAVVFFAPGWLLPERLQRYFNTPAGPMVGLLAVLLAAYNLVRWWAYRSLRRRRRESSPLARKRRRGDDTPPGGVTWT